MVFLRDLGVTCIYVYARTSAPSWVQPRMQKKKGQFRSPSLGLTGVLAAPRRRLSPASVRDLGTPDLLRVLRPDYYWIAFQQPVAFSTGKFAWLGPRSPKVMTRIVPGLELRGFWSSWPDPSLHQKQQPLIFLKSFSGLQARASQLLLFVLVR